MGTINPSAFLRRLLRLGNLKSLTSTQDIYDLIIEKEKESRKKIVTIYSQKINSKIEAHREKELILEKK
jgi:hypothetical protein